MRGYYEDICAMDADALTRRWDPAGTFADPVGTASFTGTQAIGEFLAARLTHIAAVRMTVTWLAVCGGQGAADWTARVTGRNGRQAALQGVTIFTFGPDMRFTAVDEYYDTDEFPGPTGPTGPTGLAASSAQPRS